MTGQTGVNHPPPPDIMTQRTAFPLILLATLALLPTSTAHASWESRAWLGAGAYISQAGTRSTQLGPGAQLGFQLQLNDFLGVIASADTSLQLPSALEDTDPPAELPMALVTATSIGLLYQFDVIQYVPYLGVSAVFYPLSPPVTAPSPPALLGAKVSVGLQWRLNREWSTAAQIELHTPFSTFGDFSLYTVAGINLGYHWRW